MQVCVTEVGCNINININMILTGLAVTEVEEMCKTNRVNLQHAKSRYGPADRLFQAARKSWAKQHTVRSKIRY